MAKLEEVIKIFENKGITICQDKKDLSNQNEANYFRIKDFDIKFTGSNEKESKIHEEIVYDDKTNTIGVVLHFSGKFKKFKPVFAKLSDKFIEDNTYRRADVDEVGLIYYMSPQVSTEPKIEEIEAELVYLNYIEMHSVVNKSISIIKMHC